MANLAETLTTTTDNMTSNARRLQHQRKILLLRHRVLHHTQVSVNLAGISMSK
ncbi:hypothetical protein KIN20_036323 [Parelaphostrongylus tenuis]|uniref:Uncharacterized protein n=1 Tax=Parelaphostrongylus tenuis TaxID=148309 RepID=A0AAD5WLK3_PARTN|nr:hypothetical protein KIN20_036323 [Parelaphostrongylus tenuis]